MNLIIVVLLTAITGLVFSCKDNGTGPDQKPFKDPRQMTWTSDTLSPASDAIQLIPRDLFVSSPNDVWLACWSDVAKRVMWHYDGTSWKESNIEGQSGPIGLDALAGNSSNDLWAGGFYGIPDSYVALSHYNGTAWSRVDLKIPGEILDMCTDANGNIWACGRNGVVLEYTNGKWIADTIKVNHYSDAEYFLNSIAYYQNQIKIITRVSDTKRKRDVYHYVTGNIKNWTIADSVVIDSYDSKFKWGQWKLYPTESSEFYSAGLMGIWKYIDNKWMQVYNSNSTIYSISGVSKEYVVAAGDFNQFLFYDGSNWTNIINQIPSIDNNAILFNVWTNGYEIFISEYCIIHGIQKTIIWHGK